MASRSPRVVAVGDGIVDLVTPPMADFAAGDFQAEVPRFDPLPGGNATNFALQMSSLGASTTFIGAVGSDSNAKLLRDQYRQYGVRARLCVDPSRPTGSTMALTWSTGRRALVTDPGANARLRLRDVPVHAIRGRITSIGLVSGGRAGSWGNRPRRFSLAPDDSVPRPRWMCRRILRGGRRSGSRRSGSAFLMSTSFSGTRRRSRRSRENNPRFLRENALERSAPQRV